MLTADVPLARLCDDNVLGLNIIHANCISCLTTLLPHSLYIKASLAYKLLWGAIENEKRIGEKKKDRKLSRTGGRLNNDMGR